MSIPYTHSMANSGVIMYLHDCGLPGCVILKVGTNIGGEHITFIFKVSWDGGNMFFWITANHL